MQTSLDDYLSIRASHIYEKVNQGETLQVRVFDGRILSYRYPAPRGYGARGMLIAVYRHGVKAAWILDDLLSLMRDPECAKALRIQMRSF